MHTMFHQKDIPRQLQWGRRDYQEGTKDFHFKISQTFITNNIQLGFLTFCLYAQWTCEKDLKKARQIENQKLQRKERKERKDVDKFTKNIKDIEEKLTELEDREKTNQTNDDIADFEAIVPANIIFGRDSIENTKLTNQIDQSDDPSTNMVSVENGESATNTINDEGLLTCGENSSPDNFKNGSGNTLQQNVCCVNTVKDESTKNFLSSSEENIPEQETKAVTYLFMSKGKCSQSFSKCSLIFLRLLCQQMKRITFF